METYKASEFIAAGIVDNFVQDNHSLSQRAVLRGLHYQLNPYAQGKLVRVIAGAVFDVAVDIRRASPSFGQWVGVTLTADEKNMLWVPPGFAHGFLTLEDHTQFLYKTTGEYRPEQERSIIWNDKTLAIDWPFTDVKLSAKDQTAPNIEQAEMNF